ncbi:hypothetical protein [Mesorhizobium sp. NZP2077]|uniref:hypothetical protein n=1 Tax=Mesorhizobium sp. NZP2077 TaxID=2483404 RepID=UPI0015556012|nr:hypothetical protein [Mesorhizobium sp. NZP2077]QKD14982.1 hypothetical protein HGP13_07520 [Mesorhizobium sp. NZP2077]
MTILIAALAAASVASFIVAVFKSGRVNKAPSTNKRFRTVFAITSEDRRESLIAHYSQKYSCGREEAMQRAIDHKAQDERSW